MSLFQKLKESQKFTHNEQAVIDFILNNPQEVINLSVDELAKVTYTSPSCIVRLTKKLGVKGYSDFKIKFASELNSLIFNEKRIEINMPFEQNIKEDDIPKRFYQMYHQVIDDVYHSLDIQQLKNIAHLLYHSDAITVYGVGSSLLIAQDFVMKCQKLRLPIYCNTQIGFENVHRFKTSKNPIAFIISNNATSTRVKNWVFENIHLNIPVILVTSNENSPLIKLCKYAVILKHGENNIIKQGAFASKISMTFLLDNIYMLIFMKDYENNIHYIYHFENSVIKDRQNRRQYEYNHQKDHHK